MGPCFTRRYATDLAAGTYIALPIVKRGVVDFAVGADWTPVAGDVKITKDNGTAGNITTLPTAIAAGNTAFWYFSLTAAELTCKQVMVTVADAATKAIEDTAFIVETFGDSSAMYPGDLSLGVETVVYTDTNTGRTVTLRQAVNGLFIALGPTAGVGGSGTVAASGPALTATGTPAWSFVCDSAGNHTTATFTPPA
jgi:hypothetical protein